jgi:hypothetical protein
MMQTSKLVCSHASWKAKAKKRGEDVRNLRKCLQASYQRRDRWKAKAEMLEQQVHALQAELAVKKK